MPKVITTLQDFMTPVLQNVQQQQQIGMMPYKQALMEQQAAGMKGRESREAAMQPLREQMLKQQLKSAQQSYEQANEMAPLDRLLKKQQLEQGGPKQKLLEAQAQYYSQGGPHMTADIQNKNEALRILNNPQATDDEKNWASRIMQYGTAKTPGAIQTAQLLEGFTGISADQYAQQTNTTLDPEVRQALGNRQVGVSPLFGEQAISAGVAKEGQPVYLAGGAKFMKTPKAVANEYAGKLANYNDAIANYQKLMQVADQLAGLKGNFTKASNLLANVGLPAFQSPSQLEAWAKAQAAQVRAVEGSMRDDKLPRVKQTANLLKDAFDVVGGNPIVNKSRIMEFLKAAQENHKRGQLYSEGIPLNPKAEQYISNKMNQPMQMGQQAPQQQQQVVSWREYF